MILNWVHNPNFLKEQQLLLVLDRLVIATRRDLSIVMEEKETVVKDLIHRNRGKVPYPKKLRILDMKKKEGTIKPHELEEWKRLKERLAYKRDEWIYWIKTPRRIKEGVVYGLGKKGLQAVQMMTAEEKKSTKVREQIVHTYGINQIFIRLLLRDRGKVVSWYNTVQASDLLYLQYRAQNKKPNPKELIRPDAWVEVRNENYWLEYDNATEGPKSIENKFRNYILTFQRDLNILAKVVWVVYGDKRRDYLERIWSLVRSQYKITTNIPEMYFFNEGDETLFLLTGKLL